MRNTLSIGDEIEVPGTANFISQGQGSPVVLIHGLAASLHDWDFLLPELACAGYAAYALDLLGHGDSPKPPGRAYHVNWLATHLQMWVDSLHLEEPVTLVGHSLGGYLALDFARRFPERTRALVLINPFYALTQLPAALRAAYRHRQVGELVCKAPSWLFRALLDLTSLAMGHAGGAMHGLTREVRLQTALDYARTAPGVYHVLGTLTDLSPFFPCVLAPTLVLWGDRDQTLAPSSFSKLLAALPNARGASIHCGHVPHQARPDWVNAQVLAFLKSLNSARPPAEHRRAGSATNEAGE